MNMKVKNKEKRLLIKFIFFLNLQSFRRVQLLYLAYMHYYYVNYLGIYQPLCVYIENDVDREFVMPFLDAINGIQKSDFLKLYASTCKVYAKRLEGGK